MHTDIAMNEKKQRLKASLLSIGMVFVALLFMIETASSQAGIFEVIHPDVDQGEIEIEVLTGVGLGTVEDGEERSVHEFAVGVGVTDFWKLIAAIEVANPEGEDAEVEAIELASLILLPIGEHDHDDEGDDGHPAFTLGLYTALEIPTEGGISEGALEIGPVIEAEIGPAEFVGNVFVEVPFADGEDPGLAYASQLVFPVTDSFAVGVENYGEFEGLFGERGPDVHFAGPAVYFEAELPNGHVFEPRLAVLFGLNDDSADAVLSFNIEYKIGQP